MNSAPDNLKELKDQLKKTRGSIVAVACEAKCSTEWVRRVLNGDYIDEKVILCAVELLKKQKQASKALKEAIETATAN